MARSKTEKSRGQGSRKSPNNTTKDTVRARQATKGQNDQGKRLGENDPPESPRAPGKPKTEKQTPGKKAATTRTRRARRPPVASRPSSRKDSLGGDAAPTSGSASAKGKPKRTAPRTERPKNAAVTPRTSKSARRKKPRRKEALALQTTDATGPNGLSDEERIESAKYLPRDLPPRLFEEERFVFPETYGVNRVRLLARDPQWLFAHWDVDTGSLRELRRELGERATAMSRLTLRITDPERGGAKVIHMPVGTRSWYVRADSTPRSYRAELGFTLPSGEFRKLAESATVKTPWAGPAPQKAKRRARYDRVESGAQGPGAQTSPPTVVVEEGPWQPETDPKGEPLETAPMAPPDESSAVPERGGASDRYRR